MVVPINKIREVKRKYEKKWLAIKEVIVVGIGITSGKKDGIIVSVKKMNPELRKKIPDEIENIPIEIQEIGDIKAL